MQIFGYSLLNYAISWFAWDKWAIASYDEVINAGTWFDFIYYSVITFSTIGFGDIHPISNAAKFSAVTQAIISHITSILFLAILFVYISSTLGSEPEERNK